MIVRTVIWKDISKVERPSNMTDDEWNTYVTDNDNAKSDFETNYKSSVVVLPSERYPYDYETDYNTFKSKIDGTAITWADVLMYEDGVKYVLYVDDGR